MRGEIVDRRMVVTCFYRTAYVLEKVLDDLWLDVYIWVDALWKIQSSFRSAEIGRFGVHPLRAPIVNVFVGWFRCWLCVWLRGGAKVLCVGLVHPRG